MAATAMLKFSQLFKSVKCAVIGMIHVKALPGTPFNDLNCSKLVEAACQEAAVYAESGLDGVLVENMYDLPYVTAKHAGPEQVAFMTRVCSEVKKMLPMLPCGVQLLAANNVAAVAVAAAAGLQFVRAEGFVFSHVADEGIMDSCAGQLLRYRRNIGAEDVLVFADIKKKHCAHAITADVGIAETAKAAEFFQCDGVILTGTATGQPPSFPDLKEVKSQVEGPVLLGSGIDVGNIEAFFSADAVIVGSSFKQNGHWRGTLDPARVNAFMKSIYRLRQKSSSISQN
ncbi:uncharacterized protein ISCGN_000415 [Ixodes scapularis]